MHIKFYLLPSKGLCFWEET